MAATFLPTADEEFAAALYDALLARSQRKYSARPRRIEVPGELAFFLDELIGIAAATDATDTIADVIDLGMVTWFGKLGEARLRDLGLPAPADHGSEREETLAARVAELEQALAAERKRADDIAHEVDEGSRARNQPKRAWQHHSGYVALTAHGLSLSQRLPQVPPRRKS